MTMQTEAAAPWRTVLLSALWLAVKVAILIALIQSGSGLFVYERF